MLTSDNEEGKMKLGKPLGFHFCGGEYKSENSFRNFVKNSVSIRVEINGVLLFSPLFLVNYYNVQILSQILFYTNFI